MIEFQYVALHSTDGENYHEEYRSTAYAPNFEVAARLVILWSHGKHWRYCLKTTNEIPSDPERFHPDCVRFQWYT